MSENLQAAKFGWYVIQVRTGQEHRLCSLIERACEDHDASAEREELMVGLCECFSPRFKRQKKWKGEWLDIEYPLLPGYVVADVRNPVALAQAVRTIHEFSRVLATEETYDPLDEAERAWIESQTRTNDRVIPLSFGYKEGDRLKVTDGPLKGKEGIIKKFDRQNGLAHIEFHVGTMTIHTKVGLVVMPSGKVRQAAS